MQILKGVAYTLNAIFAIAVVVSSIAEKDMASKVVASFVAALLIFNTALIAIGV